MKVINIGKVQLPIYARPNIFTSILLDIYAHDESGSPVVIAVYSLKDKTVSFQRNPRNGPYNLSLEILYQVHGLISQIQDHSTLMEN